MEHIPSYNATEVEALEEARRIVSKLCTDRVYNHPVWNKLDNVERYIRERQKEELAATFADPEAK